MNTKLSILCDKFIEAGWLAALILTPLYMNIYTHRMFEPDKSTIVRCLALLMLAFYITKIVDNLITKYRSTETTPPQKGPSSWIHFIKTPLFISFGLFVIAYIISVIFSAVPYNSIWGGYDRMQGLYTTAGYWVIFLMVAMNLRTKAQIERVISTIIFTSIAIVAYAFIQWFGQDPVPWQAMDPSLRASATMGNPAFLAAYLIMIIPLTLTRLIQTSNKGEIISAMFYALIMLSQIISVFLTKSPVSIVAMGIGICVYVSVYALIKRNIITLAAVSSSFVAGIIFLVLFNLPNLTKIPDTGIWHKTFGKLMAIGHIRPLGQIADIGPYTSGRTNIIMWKGVWKLITDKDEPYRFFIGYGPESLSTVYYKNYTMELAKLEGANVHADRAHNGYLDIWVWHGILGIGAYILLLITTIYIALKSIYLYRKENTYTVLIILGFLSTLITHQIQVFAGFEIVSTITFFWILIAVIYALYRIKLFPPEKEAPPAVTPVEPQADETPAFVTIYSTHDPSEISIIRLKLQDSGIPFVIQNENTQNMLPGVDGFVQAQIQVLQNDIDNAKLLLQGIVKDTNQIQNPPILNIPDTFNWKRYLLIGYALLTIAIAFIMFYFSWADTRMITPEIKTVRDALLVVFCLWLLAGLIVGIMAWPRYLFWTYAGQTILLAIIIVRRYWPDDSSDTDIMLIYTWVWFLLGFIIGALSIKDTRKPIRWGNPEGVMAGMITLTAAMFVIINVNLPVLRADGFYKFCFSYDQSAEEVLRTGKKDAYEAMNAGNQEEASKIRQTKRNEAYQIRLMCIRHFQNALRFAPDERAYLNGSGRNFLELAKLAMDQSRKNDTNPPNQLKAMPSIKELTEGDFVKRGADNRPYTDYNYHDFAVCSFSCIQRAYNLDPKNYERIIALIRIYRYLGDMDRDIAKIEKALKLCDEARKASPQNTKTDDEIKDLQQRLKAFSK